MTGIFITYRRDDSLGFAGRLDDGLTQALVLVVLYLLIRRAGGRELNALLDRLIASLVDAVNTIF